VLEVVFVPGAAVGEVLPVEAGARLNHTIKLTEFFNILYFVNIDGGRCELVKEILLHFNCKNKLKKRQERSSRILKMQQIL